MNPFSSSLFRVATMAIALPILGFCTTDAVTGPTIGVGLSPTYSSTLSTSAMVNGDPFSITGTIGASYGNAGSFIEFNPIVTYLGTSALTHSDTVTVSYTQAYFDNGPGSFDGTYSEHIPLQASAGVSDSAGLMVDGQALPTYTFSGPGAGDFNNSSSLVGLTGNTLTYVFDFSTTFAAGTMPGATGSSTPEPAQMIPAALSLVGFALVAFRRRKQSNQ